MRNVAWVFNLKKQPASGWRPWMDVALYVDYFVSGIVNLLCVCY